MCWEGNGTRVIVSLTRYGGHRAGAGPTGPASDQAGVGRAEEMDVDAQD